MNRIVIERYLLCPACRASGLHARSFTPGQDEIQDGVATCAGCGTAYLIEDGILELLTGNLRDPEKGRRLIAKYPEAARCDGASGVTDTRAQPQDVHKLEQKAFYDGDAVAYEGAMVTLPFWRAFDRTFLDVATRFGRRPLMLEIGGGAGRMSLPLAEQFDMILSFDISESMVRTAHEKKLRHPDAYGHLHYFVGDAENIPVRSDAVDVAIISGILHHVENPQRVVQEMCRTLRPGGSFLGNENNRSAFRPVFDFLMRLRKLWNEKAHEEHFIMSEKEITRWFAGLDVELRVWTSTFLPPHLFNLLSEGRAQALLRATDAAAGRLPWLRLQGGLVLFRGQKRPG